jgi:tetratricopeptide (TPR) repeat protein
MQPAKNRRAAQGRSDALHLPGPSPRGSSRGGPVPRVTSPGVGNVSKANKAGHAKTASRKTAAAGVSTSPRLNVRALIILAVVVVVVVPGIFAWNAFQSHANQKSYLSEAKRADDEGRVSNALQYINTYLQQNPNSLEALELKGKVLAKASRDGQGLEEAIRVQNQILARDPKRLDARKQLIELNIRAGMALNGGFFRAAETAARLYLETKGKNDAEAHRLLARALEGVSRLGNDDKVLDEAIEEYESAETLQGGDVEGGVRLAFLLRSKGRTEDASKRIEKLLEMNPKSAAVRLARMEYFRTQPLRDSATNRENQNRARVELKAALELAPGDVNARLISAEFAVRENDLDVARDHLAKIDATSKNDLRINLIKGMIDLREQKPDEAIENWRTGLIQTGGSDAELTWRLAWVLLRMGRVRDAEPLMAQYNRLVNGSVVEQKPEYRYLVALAYLQRGRAKEAIDELEAIRDKINRDLAAAHLVTLGGAYEAIRDDAKALDAYSRATKLDAAGAQPWIAIARIQLSSDVNAAVETLKSGLAAVSDDPTMLVLLAQVLLQREVARPEARRNWKEFLGYLEIAREKAPKASDVVQLTADYLNVTGQNDECLKLLKGATEASNSPSLWLARANALGRIGRQAEALAVLDEAVKKAGDNAAFRITRARFLINLGQVTAARIVLRDGLDKLPTDQWPQLFKALGDYHRDLKNFLDARKAYDEWLKLKPDSPEPYLALFEMARSNKSNSSNSQEREMSAQLDAMKKVLGENSLFWKTARAEYLLEVKPKAPANKAPEDQARLAEAEKVIKEITEAAQSQPAGHLLTARLMMMRNRPDDAIDAYKKVLPLRGGQVALQPLVGLLTQQHREKERDDLRKEYSAFSIDLDRLAGEATLKMGDTEKAEEMARKLVQGDPQNLDAAVWKAQVLNTIGKGQEAEETLRFMTQQRPEDPNAWVQLLMLQIAHNDKAAARATVETMKQKVKNDRPDLLWATCYRYLGLRELADESFEASLRNWPNDVRVHQAAIDHYETTGRPELAERSLRHLLKVMPGLDWAKRRLALNLSARRNDEPALAEAMALVKEDPKGAESPDERMLRAIVLSRSLDPARRVEAIAVLEGLVAEIPDSTKLHEVLARSYLEIKDAAKAPGLRAKALEHAAKAAGKDGSPDNGSMPSAEAIAFYASMVLEDKDVAEAERQLARLVASDPKSLMAAELNARILHAKGDDKAAVVALRSAFNDHNKNAADGTAVGIGVLRVLTSIGLHDAAEEFGPEVAKLGTRGKLAFAELLEHRGKTKEALALVGSVSEADAAAAARSSLALASEKGDANEWLDQTDGLLKLALKGEPESIELLQAQAFLRHLQDSFAEEIKVYEAIIAKNPRDHVFLNNMAWTLSENLGRPQEGLDRIDQAIKRVGWQPHLIDTRGVILLRLGKVDEAIKELETAVVALPTPAVYYHLAKAYNKAGNAAQFEKYRDLARKAGLRREQLQKSEREEAEKLIGFTSAKPAATTSASRS